MVKHAPLPWANLHNLRVPYEQLIPFSTLSNIKQSPCVMVAFNTSPVAAILHEFVHMMVH
jgi:hypothetical protein